MVGLHAVDMTLGEPSYALKKMRTARRRCALFFKKNKDLKPQCSDQKTVSTIDLQ